MDRLDTTHAANVGSTKEIQRANYTKIAAFLSAQFDSVIILLQVIL